MRAHLFVNSEDVVILLEVLCALGLKRFDRNQSEQPPCCGQTALSKELRGTLPREWPVRDLVQYLWNVMVRRMCRLWDSRDRDGAVARQAVGAWKSVRPEVAAGSGIMAGSLQLIGSTAFGSLTLRLDSAGRSAGARQSCVCRRL